MKSKGLERRRIIIRYAVAGFLWHRDSDFNDRQRYVYSGSLPVSFRSRSHGLTPEILVASATRLTHIGRVTHAVCVRGVTEEKHEPRSLCAVLEVGMSAADPHIVDQKGPVQ